MAVNGVIFIYGLDDGLTSNRRPVNIQTNAQAVSLRCGGTRVEYCIDETNF